MPQIRKYPFRFFQIFFFLTLSLFYLFFRPVLPHDPERWQLTKIDKMRLKYAQRLLANTVNKNYQKR